MANVWPMVPLGNLLKRVKEGIELQDDVAYKQTTVRLWNKGVVLRGEQLGKEIKTKRQFRIHSGQLLLSRIDVRNGAIGLVPSDLDSAIISNDFWTYEIDQDQLVSKFLALCVTTPSFHDEANRASSGTTHRIRADEEGFLQIQVPLPPLGEQRSIVARVEALAARVAEAQSLRREAAEEAEALFTSAVTNLLFDKKHWNNVDFALSKNKGAIHSGPFGSDLTHDEFVESGVAAIGTRDIQVNKFVLGSGWYVTLERFERLKQYQIFPHDVLVTIIGGSIGRFCVVPENVPLAFTTKHVIAMQFNPSIADPQFMSYMLNFHARCQETMFSQTAGSAQPSLNISKIKTIEVPVPPLEEQRRLVAYLDGLQAQVSALRGLQGESARELEALLPSVLDRAFKGES